MLELKNVSTFIGNAKVINNVNLNIKTGGFYTLLGSNGSGKSTLFKTIVGAMSNSMGEIIFEEESILGLPTSKIVGKGIVLCPEGRQLFPKLSVHKNLLMGAYMHIRDKAQVEEGLEYVYELFPKVKERTKQAAGTLSGGEQQMVAIARALMANPKLLMLDEPSIGLAPIIVESIGEVLLKINAKGTTIFLSEQNTSIALDICHYGYVLEEGNIIIQGTNKELLIDDRVRKAYLGK